MKELRTGTLLGVLTAGVLLVACIPLFTDGLFQTLRLSFRLDRALAAGEETLVHTVIFSDDVKVKKNFVQLSGRLTAAAGEELPSRVTVNAEIGDLDSGKVTQKISVRLEFDENGAFMANARVRQNVSAGEIMTVTVEPTGGDLAADAELTLCVDLVKKKKDLKALPDCVAAEDDEPDDPGGGGGADDPDATFSSLKDSYLSTSCAVAGCHSAGSASAGLVLEPNEAYANLVNVPSSQQPALNRVTPGDPDNSYLIKKLRGDGISGQRMPFGGPFLTASEIDRFVRWIQNGAPDN